CMDSVSSILEGYTSAKKEKAFNENIPHITILSRRDVIGYPLLDLDASKMMTARLQTKLYSEHLSLVLGDEIDKIFYCTDGKRKLAVGVLTKKGKKIQCSCVIQAIGVDSNVTLAKQAGLKTGPKGGILVTDRFECSTEKTTLDSVFSAGDCAEIQNPGGCSDTQVWKNWTSAREQAIQCARCIMNPQYKPQKLWFNQTIKLFGLYVACLGNYHGTGIQDAVIKKSQDDKFFRFTKLVFQQKEDKVQLIGALIIGPMVSDYRLGIDVLSVLKQEKLFDQKMPDEMIKKTYEWVPKKKFKNPLLKKKTKLTTEFSSKLKIT